MMMCVWCVGKMGEKKRRREKKNRIQQLIRIKALGQLNEKFHFHESSMERMYGFFLFIKLLTRIPNLGLYRFAIHFNAACGKFHADCGFRFQIEFISCES